MSKAKKKKKSSGGIGSYLRKINNAPAVRAVNKRIAKAKAKLKKEMAEKKRRVKKAQVAYRKKNK